MSFEQFEPDRTQELQNPDTKPADVQKFGDHQQPNEKLQNEGDQKDMSSELPKSLDQKTLSSIEKGTSADRIQAAAMVPKDNDLWPPVTIESAVGGTEGGKQQETKNV